MNAGPIAQTILQLYPQLAELGWTDGEVAIVDRAYGLACRLFTGQFAGSGKPHLCHDVGTASVLAAAGAPPTTVAAGLLHNAYYAGDFGDGAVGLSRARRAEVRAIVGPEVEERVALFSQLDWTVPGIERMRLRGVARLEPAMGDALLLRLADHIEHRADLGVMYRTDGPKWIEFDRAGTEVLVGLAKEMGFPALAREIQRLSDEWPATASRLVGGGSGVPRGLVPPRSHRSRWLVRRMPILVRAYRRVALAIRARRTPA